jgi:hypothetical protein
MHSITCQYLSFAYLSVLIAICLASPFASAATNSQSFVGGVNVPTKTNNENDASHNELDFNDNSLATNDGDVTGTGINSVRSPMSIPMDSATNEEQHRHLESKLNTLVTLDLAGSFDVHLTSPSSPLSVQDSHSHSQSNRDTGAGGGHIVGEDDIDNYSCHYSTTPIFRWGGTDIGSNVVYPHVHVGGEYDFKKVWCGLTKLITMFSWGPPQSKHLMHSSSSSDQRHDYLMMSNKRLNINLSVEKGLLSRNDYAMNAGLVLPTTKKTIIQGKNGHNDNVRRGTVPVIQHPSSLDIRYETKNKSHGKHATASICAQTSFFHPRVKLIGKSIFKLGKVKGGRLFPSPILSSSSSSSSSSSNYPSMSSSPFLSRIRHQRLSLSDESSWIPDIKVTPGGKVISQNAFALGQSQNNDGIHRVGFRMKIKKQIKWSIWGTIFQQGQSEGVSGGGGSSGGAVPMSYPDDDESVNDTCVKLEVCGLTGVNSYTSFSVEAALERIGETIKCTFLQEGLVG